LKGIIKYPAIYNGISTLEITGIFITLAVNYPSIFITLGPVACTIKLFTVVIYGFSYQARVFVLGKPFQPILMSVGGARA
jgi:hypothetical protein